MATSLVLFLSLCAAAVYSQDPCPDTRCAGPVRDLRATSITSTSVTLEWTRPELIVGPDFHYTYQIFDQNGNLPDRSTTLLLPSFYQDILFTLNGLQPATAYVINIAANNGEDSRKALIQIKTDEKEPSPPINVRVFYPVVLWGPPANPNGKLQGYEVQLTRNESESVSITKAESENYHVISDPQDTLRGSISIQVRAVTSAGFGEYSEVITLDSLDCCSESECPSLTNPANGIVTVITKSIGGTASYSCNTGYTLSGTQDRTCQPNGEWSGLAPICQPVQCPSLTSLANGRITVTSKFLNGRAIYSCNTGYTLNGPATRICLSSRAWNGSDPVCRLNLPQIEFSLGGQTYPNNSEVAITDIGDFVTGGDALLCVTDNPNCCRNPDGEFYYPDGTAVGFSITNSIYRNRGEGVVRLNRRNGATSPLGRYRCDIPDITGTTRSVYITINRGVPQCPTLLNPANGNVTVIGNTATYSCNAGYIRIGSAQRQCQSNGVWSGSAPTCQPVAVVQCPDLLSPANGNLFVFSQSVGGAVVYFCDIGYTLSGTQDRTCQTNGEWSGSAPTCQAVQCPSLSSPANGEVTVTTRIYNSRAIYSCNTGYTLSGSSSRTCLSSGDWSESAPPTCQAVQCPSLPNPANGRVAITVRTFGGRATYSCNTGYTLSGFSSRTCQPNGVWNGSAPTCQTVPDQCSRLSDPANGRVTVTSLSFNNRATYSCSTGYTLSGSSSRTCQSNGVWSGSVPSCQAVQCPHLITPANGRVTIFSVFFNGKAIYSCHNGYTLSGSSDRICLSSGAWNGSAPTCQPVRCPILTNPANGSVTITRRTFGGRATYSCNTGYTLSGSSSRSCQPNGVWSGSGPTCQSNQCPNLSNPANGRVTVTSLSFNDRASYSCNTGYTLSGSSSRTCQSNGAWSGSIPTCQAVTLPDQCPSLGNPVNGRVTLSFNGLRATYSCNSGYTLTGSSSRICQSSGVWSESAPICQIFQCPTLINPANGRVTTFSRFLNGRAIYSCHSGYTLSGSSNRICLSNGTWNGSAPICRTAQCPILTNPSNGSVTITRRTFGGRATYSCNTGYTLSGSSSRTCQSNGVWSGSAPTCQAISPPDQCPSLGNPVNGRVTLSFNGLRATYSCNSGYTLTGSSSRICQSNGVWSESDPTCQILQCPNLINPANGRVTTFSRFLNGRAIYSCHSGYTLSGSSNRICLSNGAWNGSAPTCQTAQCPILTNPANGSVTITRRTFGGRGTYSCNTGYTLSGSSTRNCQPNGVWSGSPPTCQADHCPRLSNPANGRVIVTSLSFNGRATYSCNTGYTLSGSSSRTCQFSGVWSGSVPTCQAISVPDQCPSLGNPVNGRVTLSFNGLRATYSCNSGYTLSGSFSRTCQSNGVWSESDPTCQILQCPNLNNPANGRVLTFSRFLNGRAIYSCHNGYTLSGSSNRICMSNGAWSGSAPTCQTTQCPILTNPANGNVAITRRTIGGNATYSCNTGYTLSGSSSLTCQPNGEWSGLAPTCRPNPPLSKIEFSLGGQTYPNNSEVAITDIGNSVAGGNALLCVTDNPNCCRNRDGEFYYPDGTAVGFSITNPIYRNRGEGVVRLNRRNGATSPLGRYRCDIPDATGTTRSVYISIIEDETLPAPTTCLPLFSPSNGRVTGLTSIGASAAYSCNAGYTLVGSSSRTCQSNGVWSGSVPICRVAQCPNLINPANGRVTLLSRFVNGRAIYSCHNGYTLSGSSTLICLSNGTWNESIPTCQITRCPILTNPANGSVTITRRTFGGRATYSCNTGYTLSGSSSLICRPNGVWSGSPPICQTIPDPCSRLFNPANGRVTVTSLSFNGRATYSCNTGYTLSGSSSRTCQFNGVWSGSAPTCQAISVPDQCPSLGNPVNGRVTLSFNGLRATYSCNSGYTLSGSSSRICQSSGEWSESDPTCQILQCPNLINPANGKVTTFSRFLNGRAIYSCNNGYTLSGSSNLICQSNGAWNGSAPTCQTSQCPILTNPANGRVTTTRRTFGGSATYSCNTGYTLSGSSSRTCQPNRVWSGLAPTCQARSIQCRSLTNPANGRVTITSGRATYSCNTGYTLSGSSSRTCQSNGVWSGSAPTCQVQGNIGFTLGGSLFANNSRVSLSSIGEDEKALIFPTEYENCCQTQKIGECYYPDSTRVGVRASPDQFYRNRRSQTVQLNKKPSAREGGRSASTGLYCCTVPDKEGTLQRVCANITA